MELENGKINIRQYTILVSIFTIGSSVLVAPSGLAQEAGEDAWIAAILGMCISYLFIWLYNLLGSRFPDKTLLEYSEILLGKWPGKIVSLLFITYFFILAVLLLREISDFVTTQVMPETPIQAIHLLYLSIVVMGARLGLETFTRAAEIFFPWVIVLFALLSFFLLPKLEPDKIMPILGEGMKPVLRGAFHFLGLPFLELVVFLMIFPYVNKPGRIGKAFYTGTTVGGIVLIITTSLSILVLGTDFSERSTYPSYVLAKKISIGHFLERLEAVMAGIWFLSLFFKLTVCFYASALGLAQTFKLREYRMLLLPLGMIMLVSSIYMMPDIMYFKRFLIEVWTPYSLTYGLILPLLMLAVAKIRKR
ncbi:GerAB/ArcD/ProY family transporter [Paenibacillus hamazuiensis]|uniref:GerAB/ArcD/ProY family transporter n=1 Tax=Paenibacillus hamazuiensis TaxID=2936508 RepID=UPI00200F8805|nr:endospore germination permease [Paenibacillus hamazuiensis]